AEWRSPIPRLLRFEDAGQEDMCTIDLGIASLDCVPEVLPAHPVARELVRHHGLIGKTDGVWCAQVWQSISGEWESRILSRRCFGVNPLPHLAFELDDRVPRGQPLGDGLGLMMKEARD